LWGLSYKVFPSYCTEPIHESSGRVLLLPYSREEVFYNSEDSISDRCTVLLSYCTTDGSGGPKLVLGPDLSPFLVVCGVLDPKGLSYKNNEIWKVSFLGF